MHFNELSRRIRSLLDTGYSIEIKSPPGRGKSTFFEEQIGIQSRADGYDPEKPETHDKLWGFATCFLATMSPSDLIGYIMKGERDWGDGPVPVSEATMPLWMLTREGKPLSAYKRGILLLDEYGQGESDVKRASAELLLNGRLGPWKLPKGWSVVALSNRASDRSGVTKSFDFVINRRLELEITDDLQSWTDWAMTHGVHPLFVAFAQQNTQIVFSEGVPERQGPWCTPRSLVMCSKLLTAMAPEPDKMPVDGGALEIATGMIGQSAAAQLFAFIRLGNEMPAFEDILAKPDKVRVPDKPDALMLITYNLAARVEIDTATPVLTYMNRMPKEFGVTFAKAACRRQPGLIHTDAFDKWAEKNATLLTAIVDN